MGFVDLHSHVLYGVDDGATDEAAALAMLDGLAALGITEQCVTPHQKAGQYLPSQGQIEAALAAVERVRRPGHPTLRLGAESMWDDVFIRRLADALRELAQPATDAQLSLEQAAEQLEQAVIVADDHRRSVCIGFERDQ